MYDVYAFRREANAQGLVYSDWCQPGQLEQVHIFDLNEGELRAPAEPAKVKRLVELARAHAISYNWGEHNALLQLVADPRALEQFDCGTLKLLFWHRAYRVGRSNDQKRWVSLKDWLSQHGAIPDLGSGD